MQILDNPKLPVRDLEWYKTHYEDCRCDALTLAHKIQELEVRLRNEERLVEILEKKLDASKDMIDKLWEAKKAYSAYNAHSA